MNVLFLDVDGVLNGGQTREKCRGFTGVDQDKCDRVVRIVRETDARIVLSSTWRKHPDMLPYLWQKLGADAKARYVGDTPVLDAREDGLVWRAQPRGAEIQVWLDDHKDVTHFVILDDDADMAHLMDHLVLTDNRIGLTDDIANEVIRRLK